MSVIAVPACECACACMCEYACVSVNIFLCLCVFLQLNIIPELPVPELLLPVYECTAALLGSHLTMHMYSDSAAHIRSDISLGKEECVNSLEPDIAGTQMMPTFRFNNASVS